MARLLEWRSEGWFSFATFDVLVGPERYAPAVAGYWIESARALGPAVLLVALAFGASWNRLRARPMRFELSLFILALLATGWIARMHQGGAENALLLPLLAAALCFGPAIAALIMRAPLTVLVLSTVQFGLHVSDPRELVPSAEDRAAGEALVETLEAIEGDVFMPEHGYLLELAGKPGCIHSVVINDVLKSGEKREAQRMVALIEAALADGHYQAAILDERWDDLLALGRFFDAPQPIEGYDPGLFVPVSGDPRRPRWIYFRSDTGD